MIFNNPPSPPFNKGGLRGDLGIINNGGLGDFS